MEKEHIRAVVIIEMLGKPKEHIEKTIRQYVDKIKTEENLVVLRSDFIDTKQQGEFFSTFVELEIIVKGLKRLVGFCFDYMPSSIDIIKPEQLAMKAGDINGFMNDMLAKMHMIDMTLKKKINENDFLKLNLKTALKNTILLVAKVQPMSRENLAKVTGIHEREINLILNGLIKEGKIKKEGELFTLA